MLSTRDLSLMPDIDSLRKRLQQMAALESVFAVEYGESQFEFHANWDCSEQMGAIKNGSGDEMFTHFTQSGCIIFGFAHESKMSPFRTSPLELWPGLLSGVPVEFKPSLEEPAFDIASKTFVVWRLTSEKVWRLGFLLTVLIESPILLVFLPKLTIGQRVWNGIWLTACTTKHVVQVTYCAAGVSSRVTVSLVNTVVAASARGSI